MASQMVYFESRDQAMSRILPDKRRAARAELKKLKDWIFSLELNEEEQSEFGGRNDALDTILKMLAENFYVSATLPRASAT